jgi:hypothetical protein
MPIKVPAGVLVPIKPADRLGAIEPVPVKALSMDALESACGSGGIK